MNSYNMGKSMNKLLVNGLVICCLINLSFMSLYANMPSVEILPQSDVQHNLQQDEPNNVTAEKKIYGKTRFFSGVCLSFACYCFYKSYCTYDENETLAQEKMLESSLYRVKSKPFPATTTSHGYLTPGALLFVVGSIGFVRAHYKELYELKKKYKELKQKCEQDAPKEA